MNAPAVRAEASFLNVTCTSTLPKPISLPSVWHRTEYSSEASNSCVLTLHPAVLPFQVTVPVNAGPPDEDEAPPDDDEAPELPPAPELPEPPDDPPELPPPELLAPPEDDVSSPSSSSSPPQAARAVLPRARDAIRTNDESERLNVMVET